VISFRKTFTNNISSSLNSLGKPFTAYNDVTGKIYLEHTPRLVIQVESLHRIDITKLSGSYADVLVLDEVESILAQFGSNVSNVYECFAVFQALMSHAKHVICMDANISNRTYNIIDNLRGTEGLVYHHNVFRRAAEDNYIFYGCKERWANHMNIDLDENKNIVIVSNSNAEAKALNRMLIQKYPNKAIGLYNANTPPQQTKVLHFGNVAEYWKLFNILIYTPTVTAGISFEEKHYHSVYGYFTDQSCDVETCRQMLGRVRDVGSKTYHMFISHTPRNDLPTNPKTILGMNMKMVEQTITGIPFEWIDGEARCNPNHMTGMLLLAMENMAMSNGSKNNFFKRFLEQTAESGASIDMNTDIDEEKRAVFNMQEKATKAIIRDEEHTAIAGAEMLTDHDASELKDRSRVPGLELNEKERSAIIKHRVSKSFRIHPRHIDKDFIATYAGDSKGSMAHVFRSLTYIMSGPGVLDRVKSHMASLSNELDQLRKAVITPGYGSENDLITEMGLEMRLYGSEIPKHKLCIEMLGFFGFAHPLDDVVGILDVINRKRFETYMIRTVVFIRNFFPGIKCNPLKCSDDYIRVMNSVLKAMYKISIGSLAAKKKKTPKTLPETSVTSDQSSHIHGGQSSYTHNGQSSYTHNGQSSHIHNGQSSHIHGGQSSHIHNGQSSYTHNGQSSYTHMKEPSKEDASYEDDVVSRYIASIGGAITADGVDNTIGGIDSIQLSIMEHMITRNSSSKMTEAIHNYVPVESVQAEETGPESFVILRIELVRYFAVVETTDTTIEGRREFARRSGLDTNITNPVSILNDGRPIIYSFICNPRVPIYEYLNGEPNTDIIVESRPAQSERSEQAGIITNGVTIDSPGDNEGYDSIRDEDVGDFAEYVILPGGIVAQGTDYDDTTRVDPRCDDTTRVDPRCDDTTRVDTRRDDTTRVDTRCDAGDAAGTDTAINFDDIDDDLGDLDIEGTW
jgi:hypothetical protein